MLRILVTLSLLWSSCCLCGDAQAQIKVSESPYQLWVGFVGAELQADGTIKASVDSKPQSKIVNRTVLALDEGYVIKDLAIESRSASKATHYQKTQMSNTQYQNRKFHIQGSAMRHLYPGDCGSKVYMTFEPTEKTVKYFVGKFYLDASGNLIELTPARFEDVVDKSVVS